jgi:ElaB/YqjD/DUF883 family membrane-anchored ribosome-binding protein
MKALDQASDLAHEAGEKIADATTQIAETVHEKVEDMKATEQRWASECRDYVRNNPITSLGIAAAAGFLLSRLLSTR